MRCRVATSTALVGTLVLGWGAATPLPAQEQDFVYVSNVTGAGGGGPSVWTIEAQAVRMLERLGEALRARGLGYRDVVVANVVLRDGEHFTAMNEAYRRVFPTDPPARATVRADLADPAALVQISAIATRRPKQIIRPSRMAAPRLPYSWGVKVGNTLFIAGATSRDPGTYEPAPGDVATQTRRVMGNVGLVLEAAGMTAGDLVSCRVFLEDPAQFGAMNDAYREFVTADDPPARATVQAGLMNPAFAVAAQCIAEASPARKVVIGEGRRRGSAPFSPAISTGERLYLAGMVGSGPQGVPPDVAGQTRNTLENLRVTLQAAGMDFTHVVDTWVYVTDLQQWEAVKAVLDEVLPRATPRGTLVGTPLMSANLLVEIQMVAER